jgi:hypothetical protein
MTKTKIVVSTPTGQVLTYIVTSYEIENGFVFLTDNKQTRKGFPTTWCELTEVV